MSKYLHSEIFDEYAKIALDKGLITKEAQKSEKSDDYEGVDVEAIEMLYGVKPNGKDEKHIVEQAHPESVVVAPAYDRVHGRIENQLEQQDMIANIALKPNDGKLVQRRYVNAHNELLDELLRLGFMLDKKGHEDLMKLADSCAGRLSDKNIIKVAVSWKDVAELVGVTGGAAGLGALLAAKVSFISGPVGWAIAGGIIGVAILINNFSDHIDRGVVKNCDNTIDKLQRVLDDSEEGVGLDDEINTMIEEIAAVRDIGQEAMSQSVDISDESDIEAGKKTIKLYFATVKALSKRIPQWMRLLTASSNVGASSGDTYTGPGSGLWSVVEWIGSSVITNDAEKAVKAMDTLRESLLESKASIKALYTSSKDYVIKNKESLEDEIEKELEKGVQDPDKEEPKDEAKGLTDQLFQNK